MSLELQKLIRAAGCVANGSTQSGLAMSSNDYGFGHQTAGMLLISVLGDFICSTNCLLACTCPQGSLRQYNT
jgi:hypothetical protein